MVVVFFLGLIVLFSTACENSDANQAKRTTKLRIVTVGGAITETVYALGAGDSIVGTDTSSVYPEAATKLPQVGYQRQLSAEGVLSLEPTLVLLSPDAGTPAALEQIERSGIPIVRVTNESSVDGTREKIRQIAAALDRNANGEELISVLDRQVEDAMKHVAAKDTKPRVVFIFSRGGGTNMVGGLETPADAIIQLAGGRNAVTGFSQYKPLTAEALVDAAPDVILLPTGGLATIGGIDAVIDLPGVAETPAGKNRRIVTVDDALLLGFTPRLGLAIKELCEKIR
jgi:iron complex transport system substrate-binding protein